ncbi:hypothetical protein LTR91_013592 [Friedmanniomyces endolithicus]|uniref:Uncharacterized protein n=1 Tax=Friedmanniomyces endolithicus TaxID=329885 RepID=A0AAN6KDB3_9PEZI|nr:hypothetical protein LTR59_015787 [Friedmanniomyces endolithicus]KAK0801723.1 hypothetical protein LTR38_006764 [Friedmanniomyces endolithicus]KAK0906581.1 hypothetical protein LTR02_005914 [Friedmanniomyces endolithicus]KAK0976751.1 hypothetical protein LTR91_013592 [Friedmanniomyces endolithicus]KAK1007172.1 hypothetical protein LTS01_002866 [Friedmanniomyces endolithicus]
MAQRLGVGSSLFLFGAFMVKKLHHEPKAPRVVVPLYDYISTYSGTGRTNATMAPAGPEIAAAVTAAAVPLIAWGPLATALVLIAAMLLSARVSSLFVTKVTRNFARFARGGLGMVLAGLWLLLPLLYQMYGYYAVIDQFFGLLPNLVDLPLTALLLAKLATAAILAVLPILRDTNALGLLLLRICELEKHFDIEAAGLREEREISRKLRQELERAKNDAKSALKDYLKLESAADDVGQRLDDAEKARDSAMRKMNTRKDDAYRKMTTEIVSLKHKLHGAEIKARTVELNRDVILNRGREKAKKDLLAVATKLEETAETSQARLERLNKVTQEARELRDQLQAAKTGKTNAEEKNGIQLDLLKKNKMTAAQSSNDLRQAQKARAAAEVWERRAVAAQEHLKAQLVMTKRELGRAAETNKVQLKLSKQTAKEADELRAKLQASEEELETTKKLGQGQLDQLLKDAEQTEKKVKATKEKTKEADEWYEGQIALLYEMTKKMEKKVRWFRKAKQKAMGEAQKSKQMATKARTVAKRAMGKALKMKQVAKQGPEPAKNDLPEEETCSPAPAAEAESTAGAVTQLPSGTTLDVDAAEMDAGAPPACVTPPPLLPESTPSDDSELPAAVVPEAEQQAVPAMATAGDAPSQEVITTAVDHSAAETGAATPPARVTKAVLPAVFVPQMAARVAVSAPETGNGAVGGVESERMTSAAHETTAGVASGKPDATMSDPPPPSLPPQDPAPPHSGDSVMSGAEDAPGAPGGGETVAGVAAMPALAPPVLALPGIAPPALAPPAFPPVNRPALIVPRPARAPANLFIPRRTQLRPSRLATELVRAADEPMQDAPGEETVRNRDGDEAMQEAQGGDAETAVGGDETMPDAHGEEEAGDDTAMVMGGH